MQTNLVPRASWRLRPGGTRLDANIKQLNAEHLSMRNESGMRMLQGLIFSLHPALENTKQNKALLTG